jgi:hypothetical protein
MFKGGFWTADWGCSPSTIHYPPSTRFSTGNRGKYLVAWEVFVDEHSGVYHFVSIGEMAETTTQMLALGLQAKTHLGGPPPRQRATGLERIEQMILQQARNHLSEVREGFVLSVRSAQVTARSELQFLLDRVLLDWAQLSRELGFAAEPASQVEQQLERVRQQLLAFGMAATALGYLPRMPAAQITFPYHYSTPPTYADIPTPETPGEMLWRIEELEQMLWRLMADNLQEVLETRYAPLRRTYGFFESSAQLANREAERFGVKKKRQQLSLL